MTFATARLFEHSRVLSQHLTVRLICLAMAVLSGCISIEYGVKPEMAALDELVVKQATQADVLLAMGEPRGEGGAEFAEQVGQPRDIWFYEYTKSDGKTVELMILVVFFLDGVYDGYWWFTSLEEFYCKSDWNPFSTDHVKCPEV